MNNCKKIYSEFFQREAFSFQILFSALYHQLFLTVSHCCTFFVNILNFQYYFHNGGEIGPLFFFRFIKEGVSTVKSITSGRALFICLIKQVPTSSLHPNIMCAVSLETLMRLKKQWCFRKGCGFSD